VRHNNKSDLSSRIRLSRPVKAEDIPFVDSSGGALAHFCDERSVQTLLGEAAPGSDDAALCLRPHSSVARVPSLRPALSEGGGRGRGACMHAYLLNIWRHQFGLTRGAGWGVCMHAYLFNIWRHQCARLRARWPAAPSQSLEPSRHESCGSSIINRGTSRWGWGGGGKARGPVRSGSSPPPPFSLG